MTTSQQPAAPYFVDSLNVHDEDLIFAQEFGTNAAPALGDAFVTTTAAEVDAGASINARTGMLEISTLEGQGEFAEPRGRSFLLPAWSTIPLSPILGQDARAMIIYCHLLYRQEPLDNEEIPFVDLILGEDVLIGHNPTTPFITASIESQLGQMGPNVVPATVNGSQWDNGPSGPSVEGEGDNWGKDLYWRVLLINDDVKGSEMQFEISQTGLAWSPVGFATLGAEVRRIGISVRGHCMGALDWLRAYSYVVTSEAAFLIPLPPETGARLYVK